VLAEETMVSKALVLLAELEVVALVLLELMLLVPAQ
jgi:hypothetical protein